MYEASGNTRGIPENAVIVLFAEDFVNHALRKYKLPELPSTADQYRPLVYNAFSPTMRDAANFLYDLLAMEILAEFHYIVEHHQLDGNTFDFTLFTHGTLDGNTFEDYIASVGVPCLENVFDAERFLHFCVKITKMALNFHYRGLTVAPLFAIRCIKNFLDNYDMASGGWEKLNFIATKYAMEETARDTKYVKKLTQNSSVDDYSKASTSEARNDMPRLQFPSLPSTSNPSSSKSGLGFNFEVELPSSSEAKPGSVLQQDVGSPGSIPMEGTEEYNSGDVFEDSLEAVPPRVNFRPHRSAKKRPASSISSTAGCTTLVAVKRPNVSSNSSVSNPACNENLNAPLSANSGGTNASMSPDHEPSSKIRKQC